MRQTQGPGAQTPGKELRRGYTTGTCAAAAAKAAAAMLFSGKDVKEVQLTVPAGETLLLEITEISRGPDYVSCAVVKDAGDDPDVTNGMKVFARVSRLCEGGDEGAGTAGGRSVGAAGDEGILIDGGEGVGRVTKPGLDQPPGSAAINSVPRQMIRQAVWEEMQRYGASCQVRVLISIPGGEKTAARTLNPALGIEGGLSVLGTSGIVEPMSEKALIDTIRVSVRQRIALGDRILVMAPGNYGLAFLRENYGIPEEEVVKISNYIGDSLDIAVQETASGWRASENSSEKIQQVPVILLAGHIGKLVKVAGGIMNTHSAVADCRMEILTMHALRCGAQAETLRKIAECVTTEAALDVLEEADLLAPVMESVLQSIQKHIDKRTGGRIRTEVILFSTARGKLAQTEGEGIWSILSERGREPRI